MVVLFGFTALYFLKVEQANEQNNINISANDCLIFTAWPFKHAHNKCFYWPLALSIF